MTRPWGLEVDRVELALGSVLKAPEQSPSAPLTMPPAVPGLEGLTDPIQQLAMHFLGGIQQPQQGMDLHVNNRFYITYTESDVE